MAASMFGRFNVNFGCYRNFMRHFTASRIYCTPKAQTQQYAMQKSSHSGYRRRYSARHLGVMSAILGFSLFTTHKENNQKETKVEIMTPEEKARMILSDRQQQEDSEIILLLKRARLAEMKQELEQADELYHSALGLVNINQQHKTWPNERVMQTRVYIYDSMANLALQRGRLDAAEKLFKQTMQGILQQGGRPDDNSIVEISLKLAIIYAMQERVADAEQGYKFCIQTQEQKMKAANKVVDDDTVTLLGMSVDAYSRFLVVQKRYVPAMSNLERALDIAVSVLGENHQQVAILLNDIATVASLTNDFDIACERLRRAIDIAERMDSLHLPTLYCNLAAVFVHRRDYPAARDCYNKAAKVAKSNKDDEVLHKAQEGLRNMKTNKQI